MEIRRSADVGEDGWENLSYQNDDDNIYCNKHKDTDGRNVLKKQYSLQPDMISGWMPKLPTCPIPLTYNNQTIKQICTNIRKENKHQIVYRGPRYINSVQFHKKFSYYWRYREKYQMKINVLEEAIQNVGKQGQIFDNFQKNNQRFERQKLLTFDSDFQSGNLDIAIRVKKDEFDCFIRSDTNTKGHTNWYFFKVTNREQIGTVQFNICNIVKVKNLYGKGMTPYSLVSIPGQQDEWRQNQCSQVQFVERLCRYGTTKTRNQLQFKFDFTEKNMEVYFAYSIPYTYSHLRKYIEHIRIHPCVKISHLCESFSGLELPLITLFQEEQLKKIAVIVIARIHPGETNSSFLMEGFINSFLSQHPISSNFLSSCTLYIVPMINPDGVVCGNYRTSFSGRDLNRKFDDIGNFLYPQINGLIRLVRLLKQQQRKVEFFLDFHSHSSKKDLFCYGPEHHSDSVYYLRSRFLVKTLSKKSSMFSSDQCIYSISEYKKFAARAYMLWKQHIPMTFTFEVSNGIYSLSENCDASFDKKSLLRAGNVIFQGLCEYTQYHVRGINYCKQSLKKSSVSRLSLKNNKNLKLQRKSTIISHSKDINFAEQFMYCKNEQLKEMIELIIQQKQSKLQNVQQKFSDNQQSDHDINDQQLMNLFDVRNKYNLLIKTQNNHIVTSLKQQFKTSLKNIQNEKIRRRIERPSSAVILKKEAEPKTQIRSSLSKNKKKRIYYQETHPRTNKKIIDSLNCNKKAIKQRKFPLIF